MFPIYKSIKKIPDEKQGNRHLINADSLLIMKKVINKVGKSGIKWYEVGIFIYFYFSIGI